MDQLGEAMSGFGVIAVAGFLAGVLDLTATSTLVRSQGVSFERLLQMIASGALGQSAFKGGKRTAVAGLLFHFFIAFVAAAAYYLVGRRVVFLLDHPFVCGVLYGAVVHLFMSRVVVPLSAVPKREFSTKAFVTQLVIHVFFVGLPIAVAVSYLA
jgi:hypothetical protein